MIALHILSPQNEVGVAEALEAEIRRVWPEAAADPDDRIDLLVGIRTGGEVDLLIALDLATPRGSPAVSCGLIAVEIKQLDPTRFERIGNQLFAVYKGIREKRSVTDQARDGAFVIKKFATSSYFPDLFVYAVAWLTQIEPNALDGVDPTTVGRTGWHGLLAAAMAQSGSLQRVDERTRAGVRAVRDRLLARRTVTPLDRLKAERIARDVLVRDLVADIAPYAGNATIRFFGHGGSGKSTALLLLAVRLATTYNARVLILTFHHALCGDLRHVLEGMPEAVGLLGDSIHVETATSFLLSLVTAAGGTVPYNPDATLDYARTDETFREVAGAIGPFADGSSAELVVAEDPARFDWDHVLVDEAQDWSDAERDLLMAVYGHRRLILADGLVQLMRRTTSCNWLRDVPKAERVGRELGQSLRMQHNVALFANAVARTIGLSNWSVEARTDLTGGRVVILEGELTDAPGVVRSIGAIASRGKADPVDNLICVPPSAIVREEDGGRHAVIADELRAAGELVWDASDPQTRTTVPDGPEVWRIVQYDSCRGLEGWATLLTGLDDLYANKLKHPNPGETDPTLDPTPIANRWLLIPLTRAVHLLVIQLRDPASPVAAILRKASSEMPKGVVEWYAADDAARSLSGK